MKAVMLMFDSLNREMLEPYGCDEVIEIKNGKIE